MAYSDYGGYAYRNGKRIEERSDAVLTPEEIKATPGMWPGWILQEGRSGGSHHALLGDGPIFVGLYKQSTLTIHRLGEELDSAELLQNPESWKFTEYEWKGITKHVNTDWFKNSEEPAVFVVDGHKITVHWREEDNHYQYVRLEQPDGTIWHGWSGYGVGAGLEEAGYGYSTSDREEVLLSIWPDAVK